MAIKMKRRDIRDFWNGLQTITTTEAPRKFAYAVARNRSKLRSIIEDMNEASKPIDEYEAQRIALAKGMSKKDAEGHPIMLPNGQGYFVPDMIEFTARLNDIKRITGQDKRDEEVEKLLDSEEELDIYQVAFDTLPANMRPDIMESILPMIVEPTEDKPAPLKAVSANT